MAGSLYLKSLLVGSSLGEIAHRARWALGVKQRIKHPELWEMYLEETRLPLVLRKLLKSDSCCVDVGCHLGSFLSKIIKCCPQGTHTAIEASATKGEWLKKKFPKITVLRVAVGEQAGTAIFEEDIKRPGYSHLQGRIPSKHSVNTYEVEVRRLDDLLTGKVDFIKLDIEGGELAALRGARNTLDKFRPTLLFECGSEYLQAELNFNRSDLFTFLTNTVGYKVYSFSDYLFEKGPMEFDEFRKCGLYPFRAFNFIGIPRGV